jgi:protein tyrosine phosphatase
MASKYSVKDYDIKFKDLLKELPYQPSKPEYSKLKERDQIEHVLYFNAVEAKKKENKPLNRYINIFPYDYNRIVLKEPVN